MKTNNSTQKGITLIALTVTIIVLLILAGIGLATLTGDNGMIKMHKKPEKKVKYRMKKKLYNNQQSRQ